MLNIVLVEPEIPQNCGNIARTCAATRSRLHLIRPLGFDISEKAVRRAGAGLLAHGGPAGSTTDWSSFLPSIPLPTSGWPPPRRPEAMTRPSSGMAATCSLARETAGLPLGFREEYRERCIRIPMRPDARSLNLANSVAVVAYEALRQLGFPGLSGQGEMAEGL